MIKCMYFSHFEWLWDWPVLRAELTSFSTDTCSLPPSCSGSGAGSSPAGPLAPGPSWGCRQPVSGRPSAEGHVHVHSLALRGPVLVPVGLRPPSVPGLSVQELTAWPLVGRNKQADVPETGATATLSPAQSCGPSLLLGATLSFRLLLGGCGGVDPEGFPVGGLSAACPTRSGNTHRPVPPNGAAVCGGHGLPNARSGVHAEPRQHLSCACLLPVSRCTFVHGRHLS